MAEHRATDREQLLAWQQDRDAETQAVDQALHYQALGVGMAVFCQAMYATLLGAPDDPQPFSRAEVLALVAAAVQGR